MYSRAQDTVRWRSDGEQVWKDSGCQPKEYPCGELARVVPLRPHERVKWGHKNDLRMAGKMGTPPRTDQSTWAPPSSGSLYLLDSEG